MKMILRNSWGLLLFMLAIFAGDRSTPDVTQATVDYEALRSVINEMVFESLMWAEIGDVPSYNRPIIYFDENGEMRSLNAASDLSRSFSGPYAVVSLDSIPEHILEMPLLERTDEFRSDDIREVTVSRKTSIAE